MKGYGDLISSRARKLRKLTLYVWRRHRWRAFGPLLWQNVAHQFGRLNTRNRPPERSELDSRLGIDTQTIEATSLMDIRGDNAIHGQRYQPVSIRDFADVIAASHADLERFTFIDLGSGKGRALLLAAQHPFRRIIGIEYARELHEIARRNVQKASLSMSKLERIECVWADAAEFDVPNDPLFCFLYNPFDAKVLTSVLERLRQSSESNPREIWIAYVNPSHRAIADRHDRVTLVWEGDDALLYRLEVG